jgi:L-2,4-diaminobutyric acid acetyltransferase
LFRLVQACPPLDPNSRYCNLLHCTHFAATSIAATDGERLLGFISAYRLPARPDTLFVWQVAVHDDARGRGLAGRMLDAIFERRGLRDLRYLETTVTPDNRPSTALFHAFARRHGAPVESSTLFDRDLHFEGAHDSELLLRVGPVKPIAGDNGDS